jgi:excinuclease ABC subunit C
MIVRRGRLEGSRSFSFSDQIWDDEEILSNFLSAYYQREECFIPEEVLVPMELPESQALSELLTDLRGGKVRVLVPQRGAKKALLETAKTNAYHVFNDKHEKKDRTHELLEKLQERLKLRNFPARMECYDISNFQGSPIVGSMVVFTQGEANKQAYRQYKMKDVTTQDDFASMHELLNRRLKRILDVEDEEAPDLIVIDGGKGQLGQAVAVLEDLGLADTIDVIGLAKSRVDKVGFQDESVTRSPERIFLPGRKNPIIPKQNSAELFLLQRLRDEAHRSAIGFHKKLRRKEALRSSLDDVKGVGKQTKRDLLKHFGSLKAIKVASEEELCGVKGVGERTAKAIYAHFHASSS